jgi:hypothetical protein
VVFGVSCALSVLAGLASLLRGKRRDSAAVTTTAGPAVAEPLPADEQSRGPAAAAGFGLS